MNEKSREKQTRAQTLACKFICDGLHNVEWFFLLIHRRQPLSKPPAKFNIEHRSRDQGHTEVGSYAFFVLWLDWMLRDDDKNLNRQ